MEGSGLARFCQQRTRSSSFLDEQKRLDWYKSGHVDAVYGDDGSFNEEGGRCCMYVKESEKEAEIRKKVASKQMFCCPYDHKSVERAPMPRDDGRN